MADLTSRFAGIESPNPFWIGSGPPSDKAYNVIRAFEAGWGGVVWKTLGEDGPPVVNVGGPRYGAWHNGKHRKVMGFNNIELITDRPLATNLAEIRQVKRDWPDRAMIVSLMVPLEEAAWREILAKVEDTGADGVELNLGCPHGMPERGMGAAVGQVPEYVEMITAWCKHHTKLPVIVKLTPNISDIRQPARAAVKAGADGLALINTINSIISVDLDALVMEPNIDGMGTHGGYCGPAVKPIALSMTAEIARDPATAGVPISGIGGIGNWKDAAEFMALGAANVQVCTAVMTDGVKIIKPMLKGFSAYLDRKQLDTPAAIVGGALGSVTSWDRLNLNYTTKVDIDQATCIKCGKCLTSCEDTEHQAITVSDDGNRTYAIDDRLCVGCNLCVEICPVADCMTTRPLDNEIDPRTGEMVNGAPRSWSEHPNNPLKAS